jgi:hypothetical protein
VKLRDINNLVISKISSIDRENDITRLRTTEFVNFAIDGVWRASDWEFRKRTAQLMLEPNYTTGTCSWTKLGRQVTFSGSTLSDNWRGRYWTPKNGSSSYKIIYVNVSGNYVILDTPIIDESSSGVSFEVWKRFYSLKSSVDSVVDPLGFTTKGTDEYDDITYSTGTVSGLSNSDTITGVGTLFIGNCDVGDIFKVGVEEYIIRRVESDTSLKLFQHLKSEIPSLTAYEVKKNNPLSAEFSSKPEEYKIIDYAYLNKAPILKNEDYDYLEIERDYIDAIVMRAQAYWLDEKDYQKFTIAISLYQAKVEGLKMKKLTVRPKFRQFQPTIDVSASGRY